MKIAGITLERPPRAGLVHLAGCWAAGFLAAACSLEEMQDRKSVV